MLVSDAEFHIQTQLQADQSAELRSKAGVLNPLNGIRGKSHHQHGPGRLFFDSPTAHVEQGFLIELANRAAV